MQWIVPNITLSREPKCTSCECIEMGPNHVPCPAEFCLACGTDLHVKRLRVTSVTYADVWRLHICEIAQRAVDYSGPAEVKECDRLEISPSVHLQLAEMLGEGWGPVTEFGLCDLLGVDLVGITADGTFLYAKAGEYERVLNSVESEICAGSRVGRPPFGLIHGEPRSSCRTANGSFAAEQRRPTPRRQPRAALRSVDERQTRPYLARRAHGAAS